MVEFHDYPNVLIRMLNNCIKEPHSHLVVFVMQHDVNARLDFIQVGRRPSDGDGHDDAKNNENKQQTTSPEAPLTPANVVHFYYVSIGHHEKHQNETRVV